MENYAPKIDTVNILILYWLIWDIGRLSDLPKVTKLVHMQLAFELSSLIPEHMLWISRVLVYIAWKQNLWACLGGIWVDTKSETYRDGTPYLFVNFHILNHYVTELNLMHT